MAVQERDRLADEGSETLRSFVECLLSRFRRIPVERFHKLAFLIEYGYKEKHGERLTEAQYEVVLDGCFSDEIDMVVDELYNVRRENVTAETEKVLLFEIEEPPDCESDDDVMDVLSSVVDAFAEEPMKKLDTQIQNTIEFQQTQLGEIIEF